MKWLLFTLILTGLIIWWRHAKLEQNKRSSAKPSPVKRPPAAMQQCPYCGLRFPQGEGAGSYCSKEHRAAIDSKG